MLQSRLTDRFAFSAAHRKRRAMLSRFLLASLIVLLCHPAVAAEQRVDVNRDIRPLLAKKCFACHGPDDEHREAGLRLDQRGGAIKELDSGATAIVPGKS